MALGGLIAAVPLLVLVAATTAEWRVRAQINDIAVAAAPNLRAAREDRDARAMLSATVTAMPATATIERIASVLPAGDRIVAIGRGSAGLSLTVSSIDPDVLRRALRRDPALANLRETGQRRDGVAMLVTMAAR